MLAHRRWLRRAETRLVERSIHLDRLRTASAIHHLLRDKQQLATCHLISDLRDAHNPAILGHLLSSCRTTIQARSTASQQPSPQNSSDRKRVSLRPAAFRAYQRLATRGGCRESKSCRGQPSRLCHPVMHAGRHDVARWGPPLFRPLFSIAYDAAPLRVSSVDVPWNWFEFELRDGNEWEASMLLRAAGDQEQRKPQCTPDSVKG